MIAVNRYFQRSLTVLSVSLVLSSRLFTGCAFSAPPVPGEGRTQARPQKTALDQLSYRNQTLRVAGARTGRPTVETWPGNDKAAVTEVLILTFPEADGNFEALQAGANRSMLENPAIKRFLAGPVTPDNVAHPGVQIVLEVALPSESAAPYAPMLSGSASGGWVVSLKEPSPVVATPQTPPKTVDASATKPMAQAEKPVSPSELISAPEKKRTFFRQPEREAKAPAAARPGFFKFNSPRSGLSSLDVAALQNEVNRLTGELQETINQRDALANQLATLQRQTSEKADAADASSSPTADGSYIRPPDTSQMNPKIRDAVVIQNLQNALLTVSNRLKAAEASLASQSAKQPALPKDAASTTPVAMQLSANEATGKVSSHSEPQQADTDLGRQFVYHAPSAQARQEDPEESVVVPQIAAPSATVASKAKPLSLSPAPHAESKRRELALQSAIDKNPADGEAYLALADFYASQQELNRSEKLLMRFLSKNPTYSRGYYALALIYLGEKRRLEAQATLDTYQRLNPTDQAAIQSLQRAIQGLQQTPSATRSALTEEIKKKI